MLRYVGKRLLQMIPILIIVAILIFTLMYFVPGDPVQIILGDNASEEQIAETEAALGLDKPYIVRLGNYLLGICHLDFGTSYMKGTEVGADLMERFPNTLILATLSILFTIAIGIPLGIQCAMRANKATDKILMFLTMLGNSMPGFWLALLLVLLFSVKLNWLPSNGADSLKYFILPVVANSIGSLADITRQTRSSMLEVIRSDYVVTARSKGLPENGVIWKHALPNALIPIITLCGSRFGFMLGGTVIIETVFSIPGIGTYLVNGINSRDYPIVQGSIIYIAFIFAFIMLLTDLIYAYVDPRIKAQYVNAAAKKGKVKVNEN
ncbi:MAG: ABC transporter permease [Clostridiales bacterium]|nr:ABC transporter permease [Clostridiales bacterium]